MRGRPRDGPDDRQPLTPLSRSGVCLVPVRAIIYIDMSDRDALILYDNPASTNAHKVRFLAAELGLALERRIVVLHQPTGEYMTLHPFGLVPTLVDGELVITESNVALRYLAERAGRDDLRGATLPRRARVDVLLDSLSLQLRPPLWELERVLVYGEPASQAERDLARENLLRTLHAFERLLDAEGPHAMGAFTIADCAIAGRLHNLDRLDIPTAEAPRLWRTLRSARERPAWTRGIAEVVAAAQLPT